MKTVRGRIARAELEVHGGRERVPLPTMTVAGGRGQLKRHARVGRSRPPAWAPAACRRACSPRRRWPAGIVGRSVVFLPCCIWPSMAPRPVEHLPQRVGHVLGAWWAAIAGPPAPASRFQPLDQQANGLSRVEGATAAGVVAADRCMPARSVQLAEDEVHGVGHAVVVAVQVERVGRAVLVGVALAASPWAG